MFNLDLPWIVIGSGFIFLILVRFERYISPKHLSRYPPNPFVMSIVVSLAVLGSALYIVLSGGYAEAEQKWAFGAIGTILGYWLKNNR